MRHVPALLIGFRALLGPVLVGLSFSGVGGAWFALLLVLGLLSDILDGVVARRLGVATAHLRLADSVTDGVFVLCVGVALLHSHFEALRPLFPLLGIYLLTDIVGWLFDLTKFRRLAAYHAYTTKLTGLLLCAAALRLSLAHDPSWLRWALVLGTFNHLERLAMSLILPRWTPDVPTLWHAWQRRA